MAWVTSHDQGYPANSPGVPGIVVTSDVVENDSDKTLDVGTTIGSGFVLKLLGVRVELATTATVGNRQLAVEVLDSAGDVVLSADAAAVQAASLTGVYDFHASSLTATLGGILHERMPETWLDDRMSLHIYDSAAVAAAADDMIVHIRALKFPGN